MNKSHHSKVRLLSFDFDGTLLDGSGSREAILSTCRLLAAKTGTDPAKLLRANSQVWQNYWPEVEDKWTLGAISGAAVSQEAWRRTLLACECDESLAKLAVETHKQNASRALRLFEDVREMINLLKPHLYLALITNGASDTQRGALRILDIERLFDTIVISGEVGVAKPDSSIFTLALRSLSIGPENSWHVGDSLRTDVAGAVNAGLTAVWLNRGGALRSEAEPEPNYEIRSLMELASLLPVHED